MWKDFFYFSKAERQGIIVFIIVIALIFGGTFIYSGFYKNEDIVIDEERLKEYNDFISSVREKDSVRELKRLRSDYPPITYSNFDPNIADSLTFLRLGLKPYIIKNILRYRQRGGRFKTPESFKKVYGLSAEQFNQLLPYISIYKEPENLGDDIQKSDSLSSFPAKQTFAKQTFTKQFKYSSDTLIDLNLADTTELKKIPGIGSGIAKRIVAYRNRLGGYLTPLQLQEIEYVSDTLNRWFFVSNPSIRKINLNRSGIERLKAHPYINFYQAKVIVEYRKRKGKINSLKQLALYEEFSEEDINRIEPYICFE